MKHWMTLGLHAVFVVAHYFSVLPGACPEIYLVGNYSCFGVVIVQMWIAVKRHAACSTTLR